MRDLSKLAAAGRDGDERSLSKLLTFLEPVLRGFFVNRIGSRIDVDDLVQNTLVRVSRSLPDIKDPARFKGFAMKAALFELQDYYRGRYSAKETLYDALSPPEPDGRQVDVGASVDLERALEKLTPRARKILELREFGYRYEEIAEMVGTTEAAVKMQVKRAFEKLRQMFLIIVFGMWCIPGPRL